MSHDPTPTHYTTQMPDSGKEGVANDDTSPHPPPEDSGESGGEEDDVWAAMETVGSGGEGKRKSEYLNFGKFLLLC